MKFRLYTLLFCVVFSVFAKKPLDLSIQNQTIYRTKDVLLSQMPEDVALGNKDAKVKIVVFDSYSCIHCGKFYEEIFPTLEQNYIKTNKVFFINKEFPLDSYAVFATKAVQCSQDKFSSLKKVYENQSQWLGSKNYEDDLLKITNAKKECIEKFHEKAAQKLAFEYGKVLNLKATPTVLATPKTVKIPATAAG